MRLESGMMTALILVIVLFSVSRRIPRRAPVLRALRRLPVLTVENVPVTRQGNLSRPPDLPQIPIPSEEDYLPDMTVPVTKLDLSTGLPDLTGEESWEDEKGSPVVSGMPAERREPPNPYGFVELEMLVDFNGMVDTVKVLTNTTGDRLFEEEAIKTAYRTRYINERSRTNRPHWIRKIFRLEENQ